MKSDIFLYKTAAWSIDVTRMNCRCQLQMLLFLKCEINIALNLG